MLLTPIRRRLVLTFADQSVSSASNFATGVLVARVSGTAEFGDYMLVLMIWLVVVGVHRSLVTDPLMVTLREAEGRRPVLAQGVRAEILLAGAVSVIVALGGCVARLTGAAIGELMLALSPWFLPLLVQDFWRMMAFQARRPSVALANDLIFVCVQAATTALFWLVGWRQPAHVITAWGLGATAGALQGLRLYPGLGARGDGYRLLARLWSPSRWMLADFLSTFAAGQSYLAVAALVLSRTDYGGFRAAFSLMGPTVVIMHASANIGLPEASRRGSSSGGHALSQFTRKLSVWTVLCIGVYGVIVSLTSTRLLTLLYGAQFGRFGYLASLAAAHYVIVNCVFGKYIALKVTGRMRPLWMAQVAVSLAALVSMLVLVAWLGVGGAGWAAVLSGVCYAVAIGGIYRSQWTGQPDQQTKAGHSRTDDLPGLPTGASSYPTSEPT